MFICSSSQRNVVILLINISNNFLYNKLAKILSCLTLLPKKYKLPHNNDTFLLMCQNLHSCLSLIRPQDTIVVCNNTKTCSITERQHVPSHEVCDPVIHASFHTSRVGDNCGVAKREHGVVNDRMLPLLFASCSPASSWEPKAELKRLLFVLVTWLAHPVAKS